MLMKSNNKTYERCMINQVKPTFATYFLPILQGQDLQFLIFSGTRGHILGPRNLTD